MVNDQGPAPGPPFPPFPMVQGWVWPGIVPGPIMNIVVQANDYHITAIPGFRMFNNAAPVTNLLIINQLQSAIYFSP